MVKIESLEEFVREYQRSKAHMPTEKELSDILEGQALPITILPNGEIAVLGEDLEFAKAVYAFTEKAVRVKVLGEVREKMVAAIKDACEHPLLLKFRKHEDGPVSCKGCDGQIAFIDELLSDQKIEEAKKL